MATHRSAVKRNRQATQRNVRNRALRSAFRTALKKYRSLLANKDAAGAANAYTQVQRTIDRACTKGIIHRNAAARYKSRLAAQLKKVQAA